MDAFEAAYKALNRAQREAVDYIDGPLLVIAGPGTGKTQLLSARVANILQKTDTPARNILCLTFTENGAENMRERLSRFIGPAAYEVTVSTYHAFGSDLIKRYPVYFQEAETELPADELTRRQIVKSLVENLSYTNPLRQTLHHLGDLISTISEVKRALLEPQDLRIIAAENLLFIQRASRDLADVLADLTRIPKLDKAVETFTAVLDVLDKHTPGTPAHPGFHSLAARAAETLKGALDTAVQTEGTKPLTAWKNGWLMKDSDNRFVLGGGPESKRLQALADIIEQYTAAMKRRGLYDFDDMIGSAIKVLERNDDLRFTLQEQYLYILLDEFQDTNAAQARLVRLLTDNPVSEGRPNVMAVGDDDQAIFSFQGAQYSNMRDFYNAYRDVRVVRLEESYRSHADIISTAQNVVRQIAERLAIDGVTAGTKTLRAGNPDLPEQADITRCEFLSGIAQADWIARDIGKKIAAGIPAHEIAVLAPRHKQLEPLVPYLNHYKIAVRYEKREDILETPVVKQLIAMSRLVLALHSNDQAGADALWPEVLSYDFWRIPISAIWETAWIVADGQRAGSNISWSRALLADGKRFRTPALLFLSLAGRVEHETCETMLDYLIGSSAVDTNEADLPKVASPLRDYYTSDEMRTTQPEVFYEMLSHLTVLRARLREYQAPQEQPLTLPDLVNFVDMYREAEERMVNTSPYNQRAEAVQLMTVFKSKGLEFEHVYLINAQDDVWGASSRGQTNRLTLPENLAPIRPAGATDDERLRILFVAMTRAKYGLHISSVAQTYSGKATKRLKYLDEREGEDGQTYDYSLPEGRQLVRKVDQAAPELPQLELDWRRRHLDGTHETAQLSALLQSRLTSFQLSPTHLGTFLDTEFGGPSAFFFNSILRFPEAPSVDSQFGSAMHETLEWVQRIVTERGHVPPVDEAVGYFTKRLQRRKLLPSRAALEIEHGETALAAYLTARSHIFKPTDKAEYNFRDEGVFLNDTHLGGKVDRLEIDREHRTITVVDYKTGKSFSRWENNTKLYKYRRQLYCYKLLVEHSTSFAGYTVPNGRLEFIEPDQDNRIHTLELTFQDDELVHAKQLLAAMWHHVKTLSFPDISSYDRSLAGARQFEQDLIDGTI